MQKIFESIIAVFIIGSMIVGGITYFAKASDVIKVEENVKLVSLRLEYKILGDQIYEIEKRIAYLKEKKYTNPSSWNSSDNNELMRLERELENKKIQLRRIEKTT